MSALRPHRDTLHALTLAIHEDMFPSKWRANRHQRHLVGNLNDYTQLRHLSFSQERLISRQWHDKDAGGL